MKSFFKIITIAALFFLAADVAFSQTVEPVKTGDILNWKNTPLISVGRDVVDGVETLESSPIKIDGISGDRMYTFPTGLLLRNKDFAVLKRADKVLSADRSFNYLPQSLSAGETWKHTTYDGSARCGKIKYDYVATSAEGPEVLLKIKGVLTKLKTLTVIHEGVWYSAACGGSGRAYLKYVFSPELYELVQIENRYFYGIFLTKGERRVVESIN